MNGSNKFRLGFVLALVFLIAITLMTESESSKVSPSLKIESASEAQIKHLAICLEGKDYKYTATKVLAVKSTKHSEAYYIGAIFKGMGVENQKGVWIMFGAKDNPGLTLSANAVAELASTINLAENTKAGGSYRDAEGRALLKAL